MAALLLLMVLDRTHVKEDPQLAEDNARIVKVAACLDVAAGCCACSVIMAVRALLKCDLRPLLWLGPLLSGWAAFLNGFLYPWLERHA